MRSSHLQLDDDVDFGELGVYVCAHILDDILIFSATQKQHALDVEQVLKRLKNSHLHMATKKSYFFLSEVHYLGYIILANGIKLDPTKVSEVKKTGERPKLLMILCPFWVFVKHVVHRYSILWI